MRSKIFSLVLFPFAQQKRLCTLAAPGCQALALLLTGLGAGVATRAVAEPAKVGESFAQIESLTPLQAEQARVRRMMEAQPAPYEDKVMDASTLSELDSSDASAQMRDDGQGLRTFGTESRYGFSSYDGSGGLHNRANEFGQRVYFTQQTLNYGEWNLQAEGRFRNGDEGFNGGMLGYSVQRSSARVTLRNYGLPVMAGVFADSAVGDQYSDTTDALRRNYRLFLGSSVVRGAGTRVYGSDFDITAGMGERGRLIGGPYPGFERLGGALSWLGATKRLDNGLYGGLQFSQASQVPQNLYSLTSYYVDTSLPQSVENVSAMAAAIGFGADPVKDGDYRWRLTWLHSQTGARIAGRDNRADGAFLEASVRIAGLRHEFGLYQADPNLRFADNLIASDNRGAYWRMDGNTARLSWGLGVDAVLYNPDKESNRQNSRQWGVYGNAQYRINRNDMVGASAYWNSQRRFDASQNVLTDGQRSLQANAFYQTRFFDWAPTRWRLNVWRNQALVTNDSTATGEEIQWEQDWITGKYETMRPELTSTLGYARDRSGGNDQTYPTAGLLARYWISSTWNISGTLRYTSRSSNLFTSRGLSGSVNSEASLGSGWHLGASVNLNQARMQTQNIAGLPNALVTRSNEKSAYIYLRWDGSKGQALSVAGQRDGHSAGGGTVRGIVYMDANNDGEQQAGESGVANVEVILDGRYRALTDASGQFEFPMVATGGHQLSLRAESVPLPWGPAPTRSASVEVPLRGVANVRLPVIRVGGGE